jgi:hypothetical protein
VPRSKVSSITGRGTSRDVTEIRAQKRTPRVARVRSGEFEFTAGGDLLSRWRSIIGPAGLTAVFGMGTGVAPRVWPPTKATPVFVQDRRAAGSKEERGSRERDPPVLLVEHRFW